MNDINARRGYAVLRGLDMATHPWTGADIEPAAEAAVKAIPGNGHPTTDTLELIKLVTPRVVDGKVERRILDWFETGSVFLGIHLDDPATLAAHEGVQRAVEESVRKRSGLSEHWCRKVDVPSETVELGTTHKFFRTTLKVTDAVLALKDDPKIQRFAGAEGAKLEELIRNAMGAGFSDSREPAWFSATTIAARVLTAGDLVSTLMRLLAVTQVPNLKDMQKRDKVVLVPTVWAREESVEIGCDLVCFTGKPDPEMREIYATAFADAVAHNKTFQEITGSAA